RVRQEARERGPEAGRPEEIEARARLAAATRLLEINHGLSVAAVERGRTARDNIEQIQNETGVIGQSVGEQERARVEFNLYNQARAEYRRLGLTVPDAEINQFRLLAQATAEARRQQELARVG